MDVRIGVIHINKEVTVEMPEDTDFEKLLDQIEKVLSGGDPTLWLTDINGRKVAISAERIGYVDLGSTGGDRPVGFG